MKTEAISVRLDVRLKTALVACARDDQRSMASMLAAILADYLAARGYLQKAEAPKRPLFKL